MAKGATSKSTTKLGTLWHSFHTSIVFVYLPGTLPEPFTATKANGKWIGTVAGSGGGPAHGLRWGLPRLVCQDGWSDTIKPRHDSCIVGATEPEVADHLLNELQPEGQSCICTEQTRLFTVRLHKHRDTNQPPIS